MQKHDNILTFCMDMFASLLTLEITLINIKLIKWVGMKLDVYMCMKLEWQKNSN
jgi:hypothetical protein